MRMGVGWDAFVRVCRPCRNHARLQFFLKKAVSAPKGSPCMLRRQASVSRNSLSSALRPVRALVSSDDKRLVDMDRSAVLEIRWRDAHDGGWRSALTRPGQHPAALGTRFMSTSSKDVETVETPLHGHVKKSWLTQRLPKWMLKESIVAKPDFNRYWRRNAGHPHVPYVHSSRFRLCPFCPGGRLCLHRCPSTFASDLCTLGRSSTYR